MSGSQPGGPYVRFKDGSYMTVDANGYWGLFDRFGTERFYVTQAGVVYPSSASANYYVFAAAAADSSAAGKLFLSSTTANYLKYYDRQGTPSLHQLATLDASSIPKTALGALGIVPADLGTITDATTLDQSGAGSTLEVKALGIANAHISATAAIAKSKLAALGIVPADLGTITDGITLDQSGTGSTLEVKLGGAPIIRASYSTTGNTGAVTNAINYTPPATAGLYRLEAFIDVTAWTTPASFDPVITYKCATGTAHTDIMGLRLGSSGANAAHVTSVDRFHAYPYLIQIDNSATAITLSTVGTFTGSPVYNLAATLERLA